MPFASLRHSTGSRVTLRSTRHKGRAGELNSDNAPLDADAWLSIRTLADEQGTRRTTSTSKTLWMSWRTNTPHKKSGANRPPPIWPATPGGSSAKSTSSSSCASCRIARRALRQASPPLPAAQPDRSAADGTGRQQERNRNATKAIYFSNLQLKTEKVLEALRRVPNPVRTSLGAST